MCFWKQHWHCAYHLIAITNVRLFLAINHQMILIHLARHQVYALVSEPQWFGPLRPFSWWNRSFLLFPACFSKSSIHQEASGSALLLLTLLAEVSLWWFIQSPAFSQTVCQGLLCETHRQVSKAVARETKTFVERRLHSQEITFLTLLI